MGVGCSSVDGYIWNYITWERVTSTQVWKYRKWIVTVWWHAKRKEYIYKKNTKKKKNNNMYSMEMPAGWIRVQLHEWI